MNIKDCAPLLARYNRMANERLYDACALLDEGAYRASRRGSFGSVHKLLNHILLGDRIWMDRFSGGGATTPPLNTILFDSFRELREARALEDVRIEQFFTAIDDSFLARPISYRNSRGIDYVENNPTVPVLHFFNHQTHHRGQIHVMLADAGLQPPALDLHRFLNP